MLAKHCLKIMKQRGNPVGNVKKAFLICVTNRNMPSFIPVLNCIGDLEWNWKKLQGVLKFDQSIWRKIFSIYAEKKKRSRSEKNLHGKMMKSLRNRVDVRLKNDENRFLKLISRSIFAKKYLIIF